MTFKSVSPKFKSEFHQAITSAKNILVTTHIHPDGDAIGSSLALNFYLKNTYPDKNIKLFITGNYVDRFQNLPRYSEVNYTEDISNQFSNYDLVICLDGGEYPRFTSSPDSFESFSGSTVCIDHHPSPPDKFDLHLVKKNSTSTAELVYQIIGPKNLDSDISQLLLLGILDDTGTFNYITPEQYHIFDIVKKILKVCQVNIQEFKASYSLISQDQFEIIAQFIKNSQFHHVKGWPDFQVSYITREFIDERHVSDNLCGQSSDIFVGQYIRLIKGYSWGFVVKPYSDGSCSISLRSLPKSVNVRNIVERMNIGGGHNRAAGGKFPSQGKPVNPADAVKSIISWMEKNLPELG